MFESTDIGIRYVDFLYFVERHDFISSSQLARMRGMTERGARYFLNRLVEAKYLDKTRIDTNGKINTFPYQYFITNKAKELICKYNDKADPSKLIARRNDDGKKISHHLIYHQKGVNDFFSRVIAQSRKRELPGIELWATSRECYLPVPIMDGHIVPDGYAVFKTHEKHMHFLFEYDRGTQGYSSVLSTKFTKYLKYTETEMFIHHFNFPEDGIYFNVMPHVLFLTEKGKRAKNMKEYFEKLAEKEKIEDVLASNYFLFTCEEPTFMKDVLGDIWLRAGYSDELHSMLD